MSLSRQTIRIQHRLAQWTKEGRKHWDLYRWLMDPLILSDAAKLVVENGGAPGIDGLTCDEIKGNEWSHAVEISRRLRLKTYHPRPVRRAYIEKRDGRKRPLGIPCIDDRIIERALVLLLEPIYEQVFLPCSYGFRRGKSATECVAETAKLVYSHRHFLEADIESFFDHVSHRKLLGMLKENIVDPRVLDLIQEILKAGFVEWGKPWQPTREGTPQGSPLSPLLSNVYLHYILDEKFAKLNSKRSRLMRFADDFIIMSGTKAELLALKRALYSWMREGKLKLKESKTRVVDMRNKSRNHDSNFNFLGFKFHLRAFRDNPKRFWIARQPSENSRKELHENLKAKLSPILPLKAARNQIKLVWVGWANYFRYGNSNRVFYREVRSLKGIVDWYLRGKYRQQRKPVPWKKLYPLERRILKDIKPIRVIPDSLRQKQAQPALF